MKKTILLIGTIVLLYSCKKDNAGSQGQGNVALTTDSIKILESNIPAGFYTDLTFTNETTGYAVSRTGMIIKTTDTGHTWVTLNSGVNFYLTKVQFTSTSNGYVVGGDETGSFLLKTTNAGQSWEKINLNSKDAGYPFGMYFINNSTGFVVGQNLFKKTIDGGLTWTTVEGVKATNLYSVNFKNPAEGYISSDNGVYFKTVNGGNTWTQQQIQTDESLKGIYFSKSGIYIRAGNTLVDINHSNTVINVPAGANRGFLFLDDKRCIGIGQHYEATGFWPYGDIYLTNNTWATSDKKSFRLNDAIDISAIAKVNSHKSIALGVGLEHNTVSVINH